MTFVINCKFLVCFAILSTMNAGANDQSCSDGVQNGDETDVDCGGACATWTKHANMQCQFGKAADTAYGSLATAQAACDTNPSCHGVYDNACDDSGKFYQCKEASTWEISYSIGSCVYAQALADNACALGQACAVSQDCASGLCEYSICRQSDGTCSVGETWDGTACVEITKEWLEKEYNDKFC